MLEPDQWDSALSRARGTIYRNTERISSNAVRPLHSKYFRLCDPHPITENRIDAAQRAGQACDAKRIAPFPTRSTQGFIVAAIGRAARYIRERMTQHRRAHGPRCRRTR